MHIVWFMFAQGESRAASIPMLTVCRRDESSGVLYDVKHHIRKWH
jgi:hypothetical protein